MFKVVIKILEGFNVKQSEATLRKISSEVNEEVETEGK